jgi:hypothetical protein
MSDQTLAGLEERGLAILEYPVHVQEKVVWAERKWEAFCALPDEVKRLFPYQPDALLSGAGYQPPESGIDPKEHFHVNLANAAWLIEQAEKIGNPVMIDFVTSALELLRELRPFVGDFSKTAEREFGIPGLAQDICECMETHILRFLHYFGGCEAGADIAALHIDKGGCTPHLYESTPGLQYLTHTKVWKDVVFSKGQTAIIPGFRLQHRSGGRLWATCHKVIASEEAARHGRFSIVLFVDFLNGKYYNKMHWKSLQGFSEGFFYGMPFEELDTYFIEKT